MEQESNGNSAVISEVSVNELLTEIDDCAQLALGISGEQFAEQYREGLLRDTPAVNELAILQGAVDLARFQEQRTGV